MATITIKLNNKIFPIACEDGQEQLVENASKELIQKLEQLKTNSPTATTEYLLLLSAISMQNELLNSKEKGNPLREDDIRQIEKSLEEISNVLLTLDK